MSARSDASARAAYERAQHDEGYLAWLASMEYLVEMFLTLELEGMPDDPFKREGLVLAEASLLERFPDVETLQEPESRELWDGFARYLGEVFVRAYDGEWANIPGTDGGSSSPGVFTPHNPVPIQVFRDVRVAVRRRSGQEWSRMYDADAKAAARAASG